MNSNTSTPSSSHVPTQFIGSIFVIAAPSGAGKTSLVRALLAHAKGLKLSISFTTRAPRPGEVDGQDYCFVTEEVFQQKRAAGEFLEWAKVHDHHYATSRIWIENEIATGTDIILEIDWQGARQVKKLFPDAVGIFIAPPSISVLKERLMNRGQDSMDVIARRLEVAQSEIDHVSEFEYVIINQDFSVAQSDLTHIILASRLRFNQQRINYRQLLRSQ